MLIKKLQKKYENFDDIKYIDENGMKFCYARELVDILDCNKWETFVR